MKKFALLRETRATMTSGVLALAGLAMILPVCNAAVSVPNPGATPNFDHRPAAVISAERKTERDTALAGLTQMLPSAVVSFDSRLDSPKFVQARGGFLTGPNGVGGAVSAQTAGQFPANDPHRAVRAFLAEHTDLFGHGAAALEGATVSRDSTTARNGLRTVVWQQRLDGLPVFGSVLIGHITARGELASLGSTFVPDAASSADAGTPNRDELQVSPAVSAAQAIQAAAQNVGDSLSPSGIVASGTTAGDGYQKFQAGASTAHARPVWLPLNRGNLRLCWEVIVDRQASRARVQILVDAESAAIILRRSLTHDISDATYNVYTSDSPSPFSPGHQTPSAVQPPIVNRTMVTLSALDVNASPNGWINDGDNETRGNNTDTFLDRDFDGQPDGGNRPQGNPNRVFDFPLDLTQAPQTYADAATVQMFYWVNWYHDRLYQLGFTESAGNYQVDNFGRGGLGGDEIISYVQAGADIGAANNAFFSVAPEGISGEIAMFIWDFPTPERDGDLDAEVIMHEATHGTSWRLVGGGMGLGNLQGDGMGEGWSDFYDLALLSQPTDDPDAAYAMGGYVTYQLAGLTQNYYYGIRHFPYSTDMTKNPFTFKDIDPTQISSHPGVPRSPINPFNPQEASEVHHQGEIWCVTLWDVRANLVHKHGSSANELMLQLVTDGMKLTPPSPTFLEARDAILLADQVNNNGANALQIWQGFAKRGMGISAVAPPSTTTTGVIEAFDIPGLRLQSVSVSGGNGNGIIDFNECNNLTVVLKNDGSETATGVSVRLSSTNANVFVVSSASTYLDVPVGGVLVTNSTPFSISTSPDFICGTPIIINVLIKSDQATSTNTVTLTTGSVGAQARFNSTFPVSIPDANPVGVYSPINVTNVNGALGKVSLSLYLTHTYDSDLTLELISPDGITNVLAANVGGSADNFGGACSPDVFRTTFDDDATNSIASGTAPFVGTFRPQSPLAVFKGKSGGAVNGTWLLHVKDTVGIDVGIIQCWSLFLSAAECIDGGGQCPGADLSLGLLDAPDPVAIQSNLVYTINVTNAGPNIAKASVVTHNLPANADFVSAVTTRGSVSHAGSVVTANLGNLPIGATATVLVTVRPTQLGQLTSSASVSSIETEINSANNSAAVNTIVLPPSSELAVSIIGSPGATIVGSSVGFTVTVINNGPAAASGVVLSNTLPSGVIPSGWNASKGTVFVSGNVIVNQGFTLTNDETATLTFNATPFVQGNLLTLAQVYSAQSDPLPANNLATALTVVGPAADLAITLVDQPDPVVISSNFNYFVTVTNGGPNPASGVTVSLNLPGGGYRVVSNSASQGITGLGGSLLSWNVGNVAANGTATLTVVGNSTNLGLFNASATVNGTQGDLNPTNNSAAASTLVTTQFVSIVRAGATIRSETGGVANGAIDNGETVSIEFRLRNEGNVSNTNLVATLLPTGGVTAPSPSSNNYGILPPGGVAVGRTNTFTANSTNGVITATFQITDGPNILSNVVFTFDLPRQYPFANPAAITIPSIGAASPYPSSLTVSGVTGTVGQVTATLSNLSHTYPADVQALLVGPTGQKVILMSQAGDRFGVTNTTITFSDTATEPVPQFSQIVPGSYRPAGYGMEPFPAPAPPEPYAGLMSGFANLDPNGTWSLYIFDWSSGDMGLVANGWSLLVNVITPVNQTADLGVAGLVLPSPGVVDENLSWTFTITNGGPNPATATLVTGTLSSNLTFVPVGSTAGVSLGANGAFTYSVGALAANATASFTIVAKPATTNNASISVQVASGEVDLNLANNLATVNAPVILPLADFGVGILATPTLAVVGSNLTLNVSATNYGPANALDARVAVPLGAGMSFISASLSKGSNWLSGGSVVCSFGKLVPGEIVTANLLVQAVSATTSSNAAIAVTQSSDANPANNLASVIVTNVNPRPILVAAGSVIVPGHEDKKPNVAIDPGETVTISFSLTNVGQVATTPNLTATLLNTGGVSGSSGSTNYGVIAPGGLSVARDFTFTAANVPGAVITATFQLTDGATPLGSVTSNYVVSSSVTFANTNSIIIPERGAASPYPSLIPVAGVTGVVGNVTVTLSNFSHSFPSDVDALLVGPQGQKIMLMSDAGGGFSTNNLNLTFFDGASNSLPYTAALATGSFKPTDFEPGDPMPSPAPGGSRASQLTTFNGTDPNGNWALYVVDDTPGDGGMIAGGWSLTLDLISPVNPFTSLGITVAGAAPASVFTSGLVTNSVQITNRGPAVATGVVISNSLPPDASVAFYSFSQGSFSSGPGNAVFSLGALTSGAGAQMSLVLQMNRAGSATNTVTVSADQFDFDLSDNTVRIVAAVTDAVPARLQGVFNPTNLMFQITLNGSPNQTYVLEGSASMAGPTWIPLATNTASGSGVVKFPDDPVSGSAHRFYRAKQVLP